MTRRRAGSSWSFLTFLDLITCGLGAALLLLLITALARSTDPQQDSHPSVMLVVRTTDDTVPGEVGFLYRRGPSEPWQRIEDDTRLQPSLVESDTLVKPVRPGVVAWAVLSDLPTGTHEVRPYLRDYAGSSDVTEPRPCRVILEATGQDVTSSVVATPSALLRPGDAGLTVTIHVNRHRPRP
jgi:hypothetical protein